MRFTNRLLPRFFLLLTSLMVVSALSWATLFLYWDQAPRARNFAQILTSVINLTRAALVAAAPERRPGLLHELLMHEGVLIFPAEENESPPQAPVDGFLRDVLANLRLSLGSETQLATERDGNPGIFVLVDIEGDGYWIGFPRERFDRSRSLQWLGWGILGAFIALLTAVWFVSRLTRPLDRLVIAAKSVGKGEHPPPLPEDGPEELATVATAFNQMNVDLERQNRERAFILAGISHDLRTPLTRLRMGIEMTDVDAATRDGMETDIEEMDITIGQFLDYARSNEPAPLENGDPAALMNEIVDQYRRRGVPIGRRIDHVGSIAMHGATLRRALCNLIDNSVRYATTDNQASHVELALLGDDRSVVIEVTDRGPGIPEVETERMLRPFTRLNDARSNAKGAGLGLSIVNRVVRQHAGKFALLPREGGGLIARITLPRMR